MTHLLEGKPVVLNISVASSGLEDVKTDFFIRFAIQT